jgi:CspA family cold shock protein
MMAHGEILWFDPGRGFGFIRPEMGPKDVFVHTTAIDGVDPELLRPGAQVEFELVQGGDGRLMAQRVLLSGAGHRSPAGG